MASDPAPNAPGPGAPAQSTPSDIPPGASIPPTPDGAPYAYPPFAPYPFYPDAGYAPSSAPYAYPSYPAYPAPYPWMFAPPTPRLGTWALVSMICGVVSIVSLQTILAILAIVFGFIGLNEIKKAAGQVEGRGFAIAGIVTGFISVGIGLAIVALYILYFVILFSAFSTYPG